LIEVVDEEGKAIDAVIPVLVDILDAEARPAEFSGYYGAQDGLLNVTLDLAVNDTPGKWSIRARELASGQKTDCVLQVLDRQ